MSFFVVFCFNLLVDAKGSTKLRPHLPVSAPMTVDPVFAQGLSFMGKGMRMSVHTHTRTHTHMYTHRVTYSVERHRFH